LNLVAYMIVRNELDRYLLPCIESLLTYCDEVSVWDDGSSDATEEALRAIERVRYTRSPESRFFAHEGRARQLALNFALTSRPTHILAIDADEFVEDGAVLRAAMESSTVQIWTLNMVEVWKSTKNELLTRQDGGWREHEVPISFKSYWGPGVRTPALRIPNRKMACGRVPLQVARQRFAAPSGTSILHFGWANEGERAARHHRYVQADGGRYHAGSHLDSIMWPDHRVLLKPRKWSKSLAKQKKQILERANFGTLET
jgi:glycosyltransferase involved in cell wall biosynthesis